MNRTDRASCLEGGNRIVVKVGSNVLTENHGLNLVVIRSISRQICGLIDAGKEVILITSGAMASGLRKLGLGQRPSEVPKRQAIAAVGQAGLIMEYEKAFKSCGKKVAQILLTSDDLTHRKRYLNSRNTLLTLLEWGVVPIINENDTVAVEEIKVGDNDNLAAMITLLMDADLLVNLTDIGGLFTKDPRSHSDAALIPKVTTIDRKIEQIAGDIPGALGTGGMLAKIVAARKVTAAGVPMIIANGKMPDILPRMFAGELHGTYFVPKKEKLASRKCWIAFSLKPKGQVHVDAGASRALLHRGKSLLPSGIVDVSGEFDVGAPVEVVNGNHQILGTGLVNYRSSDIRKIMGAKTSEIQDRLGEKPYDEVIHRDNLAVILEPDSQLP
ncbi:MAG: glutamate 5-kinase [Desulfobacteraceae bacterium]|nr:glutamate 5-kinase [Desulfobacteraceae bacterium]